MNKSTFWLYASAQVLSKGRDLSASKGFGSEAAAGLEPLGPLVLAEAEGAAPKLADNLGWITDRRRACCSRNDVSKTSKFFAVIHPLS